MCQQKRFALSCFRFQAHDLIFGLAKKPWITFGILFGFQIPITADSERLPLVGIGFLEPRCVRTES